MFGDESGIEDNECLDRGWSLINRRCCGKNRYNYCRRINMIAGWCNGKIIAPFIFEGTCNSSVFEVHVEQVLIKQLKPGQIYIIDNARFHKTNKIITLIESVGCSVLFLPPYSPDLNPIENFWSKVKRFIRRIKPNFKNFFSAVSFALNYVTS